VAGNAAASKTAATKRARARAAHVPEADRRAPADGACAQRRAAKAIVEVESGRTPKADTQRPVVRNEESAQQRGGRARGRGARPKGIPERSPPPRPLVSASAAPPPPTEQPDLDWDDTPPHSACEALGVRWAARGEELFLKLADHGAAQHEVRVDLRAGRFVWVDGCGRVSAEARAQVLCSWSRATSVVSMAWADPLVRSAAVPRIDGMLSERDDVDEEGAWQIAMEAAEASGATYLYRVPAPNAWYFLGLSGLTFAPERGSFHPGTPAGLVLRALAEVRQAIESRAEPSDVIRERLCVLGSALFHQGEYAYRGTEWVARLDRTGRRLHTLAKRLPRASFGAIAAGQQVSEWVERELAIELIQSVSLLEDEWTPFS
jgi:hypothetical protein